MKKSIKRYVQVYVAPFILQLFVRLIYLTNKKVYHHPKSMDDETFIVSMWHGDLLMQPFNYQHFKPKGTVKAIISEHRDGETIRRTVEHLGIESLNGSSTRGGAKALLGAIKSIKKGIDVAITPDGPKGPIYSVADGIVLIAQKTKCKILSFSTSPTKYWQFNSWDKFIVPKPFGQIDFYISEPFDVDGLDMEEAKKKIENNMRKFNV